ncbi:NUDIX hydrolase [Streptococcus ruminantium]|uniref:NUDIX hydrolase n=1 Tax=Streptococcus ruminantium TaxID=1917441 RepID=UPI0012DEE948|nr:NUDIX domain-containing protein [Streptococcus ruminantium]
MDFRTIIANQSFGVRATALIIKDGKIFLTKDDKGRYYTIGGAIEVNELVRDAVIREVKEELGVDCLVNQLAFVVENQFIQEKLTFHNIEFHFIVQPLGEMPNEMIEGEQKQTCEWIDLDNLVNLDIVPAFLTKELPNWNGQMKHITNVKEKIEHDLHIC